MKCKHFEPSQNERALFENIRWRFFICALFFFDKRHNLDGSTFLLDEYQEFQNIFPKHVLHNRVYE
jgi:hypothetical protein